MPALLTDAELEAVQRRAQGATRERMLRELVEAPRRRYRDAPLVLVLEDLHWSDSATVDLLAMLARRREPRACWSSGRTGRPTWPRAAHPLKAVKQELQLHGHCEELALDFLSEAAVGEYLARRFPAACRFTADLARVLHENTTAIRSSW